MESVSPGSINLESAQIYYDLVEGMIGNGNWSPEISHLTTRKTFHLLERVACHKQLFFWNSVSGLLKESYIHLFKRTRLLVRLENCYKKHSHQNQSFN